MLEFCIVNYGYLLQAAISKQFGAQACRFHYWIRLEVQYDFHVQS